MSMTEALIVVALLAASAAYDSTPRPMANGEDRRAQATRTARPDATETSVYYAGCNEVRALGKAPLYAGQPGYRIGMDGDRDGIACEPHRNRRR